MRLPLSILSLLASVSVPTLAITLSGKVIDQSGAGKAGVTVALNGSTVKTDENGTWSLSGDNSSISSRLSGSRQVTAGGHLLVDEGHLRVSLSGYDLMGRPRTGNAVTAVPAGTVSDISARATTVGVDTLLYSWNGTTFLRDTASTSRSGIVAIFDTIPNARILYGWLTDTRDNKVYRTVKIGTQIWMAQNLNYQVDSSWCPSGIASNCATYGRLYRWSSAMALSNHYDSTAWGGPLPHQGACPSGWHVPSDTEWSTLVQYVDSATSGTKLKANSSLWNTNTGTDGYGFSVLPAGIRYIGGTFYGLGIYAFIWSSSENAASACKKRQKATIERG